MVAVSEELFKAMKLVGLPVGVSVLCPGWVRSAIMDADRNWPARLGERPPREPAADVVWPYYDHAIAEGMDPIAVADMVADAIVCDRFWISCTRSLSSLQCAAGSASPNAAIPKRRSTCLDSRPPHR